MIQILLNHCQLFQSLLMKHHQNMMPMMTRTSLMGPLVIFARFSFVPSLIIHFVMLTSGSTGSQFCTS